MATSTISLKKCFICNKKYLNNQLRDAGKCLNLKAAILLCDTCHEKNISSDEAIFSSRVIIGSYITNVFKDTTNIKSFYNRNYYSKNNGYFGQIGTALIKTNKIPIYNVFDTKFMTYTFLKNRILKKIERAKNRVVDGEKNYNSNNNEAASLFFDIKCVFLKNMDDVLLKFFGFKYIIDSKNKRRKKKF